MALINCPHCGKNVSDTASSCIHCGKSIIIPNDEIVANKQVDYSYLNITEKIKLNEEFRKEYPNQKDYEKREANLKKLSRISMICIIVSGGLSLLIYLTAGADFSPLMIAGLVTCLILFFASDVIDLLCPFLIRRNKKKSLIYLKIFQKWLSDKKNINYTVTFYGADRKWKNYFDEINVAAEGYKG